MKGVSYLNNARANVKRVQYIAEFYGPVFLELRFLTQTRRPRNFVFIFNGITPGVATESSITGGDNSNKLCLSNTRS